MNRISTEKKSSSASDNVHKVYSAEVRAIFTENSVAEAHLIEKQTRNKIAEIETEMKETINRNFSRWLESANSSQELTTESETLLTKLVTLKEILAKQKIESLSNTTIDNQDEISKSSSKRVETQDSIDFESGFLKRKLSRRSTIEHAQILNKAELCKTAVEIKVLTDTPEQIWQDLERKHFLQAAIAYSRSQEIYNELYKKQITNPFYTTEKPENFIRNSKKVSVFRWFPVIEQQWAIISRMKGQIINKCNEFIAIDLLKRDLKRVANALCGLILLEKIQIGDVCKLYLKNLNCEVQKSLNKLKNEILNDLDPKQYICLYVKKAIQLLKLSVTHFMILFGNHSLDTNGSDSNIIFEPSLLLKALMKCMQDNSATNTNFGGKNHLKSLDDVTSYPKLDNSSDHKLRKSQMNQNDLMGWTARRRSSLVGGNINFSKEESMFSTGYQLSGYLSNSARFFKPNLSHLEGFHEWIEKHYSSPRKNIGINFKPDDYQYTDAGFQNESKFIELLSVEVIKMLNQWFSETSEKVIYIIRTLLDDFDVLPSVLGSSLLTLVDSEFNTPSDFSKIDPGEDTKSYKLEWSKVCKLLAFISSYNNPNSEAKNNDTPGIKKNNNSIGFDEITSPLFNIFAPFFSDYALSKTKNNLTKTIYNTPIETLNSWNENHYFDLDVASPAWSLLPRHAKESLRKSFIDTEMESVEAELGRNFYSIMQIKRTIHSSIEPFPEPVEYLIKNILNETIYYLNDFIEWNTLLAKSFMQKNIQYNTSFNEPAKTIGVFCTDLLKKLSEKTCEIIKEKGVPYASNEFSSSGDITNRRFSDSGLGNTTSNNMLNLNHDQSIVVLLGHFASSLILLLKESTLKDTISQIIHLDPTQSVKIEKNLFGLEKHRLGIVQKRCNHPENHNYMQLMTDIYHLSFIFSLLCKRKGDKETGTRKDKTLEESISIDLLPKSVNALTKMTGCDKDILQRYEKDIFGSLDKNSSINTEPNSLILDGGNGGNLPGYMFLVSIFL
ncbi:hypothetical protein BB559_002495 [Furculomyces boomerangus]|uniref:Conserved oligomeric Golgi complex subunit 1 n=1 Tax=Furculomyces boomerangus TaxID=61424 RepID=A0A2T9YUX5_9FUNG|nr:hypothetical protein BB559_002495 [Furculomyces boomerangus]